MFAYPGTEHIGRVTGIAQHIDMGAAVAEPHHDGGVVQDLAHLVDPRIERGHGELDAEIILDHEIEKGIDVILAALPRDIGDRFASSGCKLGALTSCTVMRSQLAKLIGFFSSSRKALRNAGSA